MQNKHQTTLPKQCKQPNHQITIKLTKSITDNINKHTKTATKPKQPKPTSQTQQIKQSQN